MTRRSWVNVVPGASCVVWTAPPGRGRPATIATYSAFEMSAARAAIGGGRRPRSRRDVDVGREVLDRALVGDVVYAAHCRATSRLKIGRTTDLPRRWAKLETSGGYPLQLVVVWREYDTREHERTLHDSFDEHRGAFGEWFDARPVLDVLRADAASVLTASRAS